MNQNIKISIFIPTYNAELFIESVIERIPDSLWVQILDIWIINDGSTDATQRVVEKLNNKKSTIKLVNLKKNRGYGTAVQIGLRKCQKSTCDFAVCLHADGQYPPESIEEFIHYMKKTKCDILQGSRIASNTAIEGGMPLYKYVAGRTLTFFENKVFNLHMTDYHSGFILYSRSSLNQIPFHCLSRSFDFDLEVIAYAKDLGLNIAELPIPTHYGDEKSYLNPIFYGFRVLGIMGKYLLGRYRRSI